MKCKRKHINLGARSFTCDVETNFKETDAEPLCDRMSKFLLMVRFDILSQKAKLASAKKDTRLSVFVLFLTNVVI